MLSLRRKAMLNLSLRGPLFILSLVTLISCSHQNGDDSELVNLIPDSSLDGNADLNCIFTPTDLAIDSEGKVFILDVPQSKILVFNEQGDLLYDFGRQGEGPGEFSNLYLNFDLDDSGLVYLIDNLNWVNVFNNDGSYRYRFQADVGQIHDIAAVDSNRIYINAFPGAVNLLSISSVPAVIQLDANGDVIREIGLLETDLEDHRQRKMHFSCAIDTDEEKSIYYASLADYSVAKYDSSGVCIWSVIGTSSFSAYSEQHELGSSLHPVIWDLDVEQGQVFILWAQGGDDRGYRVDVFDADNGNFSGHFYTQTPSEMQNMFIEINDDYFLTVDYEAGIVYKYLMCDDDNT